jgi:sarcosine oxidase subunit gamma
MLEAEPLAIPGTSLVKLAPPRSIVSIAAFAGTLPQLQSALGVVLPKTPRRVSADGVTYLWAGPQSWLAISDDPALASRLAAILQNLAAVTDQSDGRVTLSVSGRYAREILARLAPIDLYPSVFPADATALTLAGHISVQIWQDEAGDFQLACFRSFAEALYHSLAEAAREYEG